MISFARAPLALAAIAVTGLVPAAHAAVAYSTPGSTYSQNFDSLPNSPENTSLGAQPAGWIDDTTAPAAGQFSIPGWYLYHALQPSGTEIGANGHQRLRAGPGSQNTGAFWSYGASGTTERALGILGSTTIATQPDAATNPNPNIYIALRLNNTTGQLLNSFTVSFNGEQWRDGGANGALNTMTFGYSLDPAATVNSPNATFTDVSSATWSSPVANNSTTGAAVNGNTTGRVPVGPVTVSGISWAPGTDLWLRWNEPQDLGNDHGMAIDDFAFSATFAAPPAGASASLTPTGTPTASLSLTGSDGSYLPGIVTLAPGSTSATIQIDGLTNSANDGPVQVLLDLEGSPADISAALATLALGSGYSLTPILTPGDVPAWAAAYGPDFEALLTFNDPNSASPLFLNLAGFAPATIDRVAAIPEPASLSLAALAACGFATCRRHRRA